MAAPFAPITSTPAAGTPVRVGSCERTGGLVAVVADVELGLRAELELVLPVGTEEAAVLVPVLAAVAGAGGALVGTSGDVGSASPEATFRVAP